MPSLIDQFFHVRGEGNFQCKLCGVEIQGKGGRTSNVSKHLRVVHKNEYDQASAAGSRAQLPIDEFGVAAHQPYHKDSKKHKDLTKKLVCAIADGYLPPAVVDRTSFRQLVTDLNPRYSMPRRKAVTEAVTVEGQLLKQKLNQLLSLATTVAVTLDLWSNPRMKSFLGETAHFITEKDGQLTMHSYMLACKRFQDRHTATNISWQHQEILEEFDLSRKAVVAITDSAANMKKAFVPQVTAAAAEDTSTEESADEAEGDDLDPDDELEMQDVAAILDGDASARPVAAQRISCGCHTLQLVVQDGLKALPSFVSRQVARVNSFVSSVKRSTVAAEIMEKRSGILHVANATRWNSQLRSLSSYLVLNPETVEELAASIPSIAAKVVDQAGRKALEDLVELLTPLGEATDELQGEKEPTGSSLLPTLRILRLRLAQLSERTHGQLARVARTLLDSLNKRFDQYSTVLFQTATVLDPRYKLAVLSASEEERAEIRSAVEEELVDFLHRFQPLSERHEEAVGAPARSQPSTSRQDPSEPPAKRSFFDLLDEEVDQPAAAPAPLSIRQRLSAELWSYLEEAREGRETGRALAYWSAKRASKPLLRHCAQHWLAIPASSAPSERLFSVGGKFYCPSRSRLTPRVFESLMFVKSQM